MFVATRLRRAVRAAHDSGNLYVGLGAAGLVASGGLAYREWREDQRLEAMREIRAQIRDLKKDQDEKLRAKREGARFSDRKAYITPDDATARDATAAGDGASSKHVC
ncbi:hypothetical protein SO694_00097047 [Aureococcus anophagefferens]|uniref:HIG1 domain-containing protein n=1 Tax=Aureococcus anophagefferens TaxID=44056 RepID=A0ABR1FS50_AURAN